MAKPRVPITIRDDSEYRLFVEWAEEKRRSFALLTWEALVEKYCRDHDITESAFKRIAKES